MVFLGVLEGIFDRLPVDRVQLEFNNVVSYRQAEGIKTPSIVNMVNLSPSMMQQDPVESTVLSLKSLIHQMGILIPDDDLEEDIKRYCQR